MVNLPIDQLKEHPKQNEFFKPLEGKAWEEFYTDLNTRGIQQPVIVSDRTGEWVIADGHQRVRAAKYLGWREVPCIMGAFESEPEEVRCLVMNNARRRQLSRAEIDSIIGYWLANYNGRSNNWIASDIGTTDKTVEAKRKQMEEGSEIPNHEMLEGKDGKKYPRSRPRREVPTVSQYLEPKKGCNDSAPPSTVSRTQSIEDTPPLKLSDSNVIAPITNDDKQELIQSKPEPVPRPTPPGWQSTELRKDLERAFTILTKHNSDEGQEELQRDPTGRLRGFAQAAYKQLGEMLEHKEAANLITIKN